METRLSRMVGPGLRFPGYDDLLAALLDGRDGALMDEFINSLTTNYSYFFRDKIHFSLLARYLHARGPYQPELRLWSAAASTGEDAYSMAMVLLENQAFLPADTRILATDISLRALRIAEEGIYPAGALRGRVDPRDLTRYFVSLGAQGYRAGERLRSLISFRYLNLLSEFPFTRQMDVVFLRNVLIYLGAEEKRDVLQRIYACIRPGGILALGLSESLVGIEHPFSARRNSVYLKDG
jgi:chemotaxis protein methyltransferase CheR